MCETPIHTRPKALPQLYLHDDVKSKSTQGDGLDLHRRRVPEAHVLFQTLGAYYVVTAMDPHDMMQR